jgi:hypothetical protein
MKESDSQIAPVANAPGSPTLHITSSDVQRENRIPPRQVLTRQWPVLHAGTVPDYAYFDSQGQTRQDWRVQWTFRIWGLVEAPWQCNYHEFIILPRVEVVADILRREPSWAGHPTEKGLHLLPQGKPLLPFLGGQLFQRDRFAQARQIRVVSPARQGPP